MVIDAGGVHCPPPITAVFVCWEEPVRRTALRPVGGFDYTSVGISTVKVAAARALRRGEAALWRSEPLACLVVGVALTMPGVARSQSVPSGPVPGASGGCRPGRRCGRHRRRGHLDDGRSSRRGRLYPRSCRWRFCLPCEQRCRYVMRHSESDSSARTIVRGATQIENGPCKPGAGVQEPIRSVAQQSGAPAGAPELGRTVRASQRRLGVSRSPTTSAQSGSSEPPVSGARTLAGSRTTPAERHRILRGSLSSEMPFPALRQVRCPSSQTQAR